ncbi:MAG: restriction endonuclease subunit S [Streptococcus sp.]
MSLAINANKKELIKFIKGTSVRHIHNADIKTIEIPMPQNNAEQEKLVNYFKNLDNLITLQQEEIDGYKELKSGLLQQMFC